MCVCLQGICRLSRKGDALKTLPACSRDQQLDTFTRDIYSSLDVRVYSVYELIPATSQVSRSFELVLFVSVCHCECLSLRVSVTASVCHCECLSCRYLSLRVSVTACVCHCECLSLRVSVTASVCHCECLSL